MADNSDDEAAVVLLSLIGEVIAQEAALRRMQRFRGLSRACRSPP